MLPERGTAFPLAPMSPFVRGLTGVILAFPVLFLILGLSVGPPVSYLLVPLAGLLLCLDGAVWLWARPTRFEVTADALVLVWPLRRRRIPRAAIRGASVLDRAGARRQLGVTARIGVGGLWGGFGWAWSSRLGLVELWVSRGTDLVLVERRPGRALILTPDRPEAFVAALGRPGS